MREANLFTMLSAYQPGSPADPFEAYCSSGLAYLLNRGHHMLTALFRNVANVPNEPLADVEIQPRLGDAGITDILLTFEGGHRIILEVQVEPPGSEMDELPKFEAVAEQWDRPAGFVILGLKSEGAPSPWNNVTWRQVADALEGDPDELAQGFRQFVINDVLGLGAVPLDDAITSNRLFALGGAAVRRRFGVNTRYANAAPMATGPHYRYRGTMFSKGESGEMDHWIGIVNETVPLGEHYQLMLASKYETVAEPTEQPRALGNWSWAGWTGMGRVVRPITPDMYDELLDRLER